MPLFVTNSLFNMKQVILTYKSLLIQNKVKQYWVHSTAPESIFACHLWVLFIRDSSSLSLVRETQWWPIYFKNIFCLVPWNTGNLQIWKRYQSNSASAQETNHTTLIFYFRQPHLRLLTAILKGYCYRQISRMHTRDKKSTLQNPMCYFYQNW